MRRINSDLIRAEEELAGARQCIICLCGALITSSGTALLYKFDAMPAWGMVVASLLLTLFLVAGLLYAFLPTLQETRYPPRRPHDSHTGRHVDPE